MRCAAQRCVRLETTPLISCAAAGLLWRAELRLAACKTLESTGFSCLARIRLSQARELDALDSRVYSASLSKASRPLTPQVALNSSSPKPLKSVSRRAMPRPSGPPLLVACYDGRVEDVRKLLAAGADPRLPCGDQRISWRFGWNADGT